MDVPLLLDGEAGDKGPDGPCREQGFSESQGRVWIQGEQNVAPPGNVCMSALTWGNVPEFRSTVASGSGLAGRPGNVAVPLNQIRNHLSSLQMT